jgi:Uma2 family endonuclease
VARGLVAAGLTKNQSVVIIPVEVHAMATQPAPRPLTFEEYYELLGETETRYELVDGVPVEMPPPTLRHQVLGSNIEIALRPAVGQPVEGFVLREVAVKLSPYRAPNPDVCVHLRSGRSRLTKVCVDGPPDLAVEVLSPGNRDKDLERNVAWYAEHGVTEYWIVDSDRPRIQVYRLERERFGEPRIYNSEDILTSPLLPRLALRVASLYEGLPEE